MRTTNSLPGSVNYQSNSSWYPLEPVTVTQNLSSMTVSNSASLPIDSSLSLSFSYFMSIFLSWGIIEILSPILTWTLFSLLALVNPNEFTVLSFLSLLFFKIGNHPFKIFNLILFHFLVENTRFLISDYKIHGRRLPTLRCRLPDNKIDCSYSGISNILSCFFLNR